MAAGLVAGALNAAVGSGTLVLYPAYLMAGLTPVVANATNTVSLIFASVAGAWQYRDRLEGFPWRTLAKWAIATGLGGLVGALLVVALPPTVFNEVIPWLILLAVALFGFEPLYLPRLKARLAAREAASGDVADPDRIRGGTSASLTGVGVYSGYFGGGQGVAYLLVLTVLANRQLQQANAIKNQMSAAANVAAAIVFVSLGDVRWWGVALGGLGALVGGLIGARFASALPESLLRLLVVGTGIVGVVLAVRA